MLNHTGQLGAPGGAQPLFRGDPEYQVQAGQPRSELAARPGEHLTGQALLHDMTVLQHHHPVREHQRIDHLVGDDEREPVGEHGTQQRPQGRRELHVHRGERLVQQQQIGIRGQRPGQRDALGLTTGQAPGAPLRELGRIDLSEPLHRQLPGLRLAHARGARRERDVVQHGQVREQQGLLGEQPDVPTMRWQLYSGRGVGEHPTVEHDPAAIRAQQPRNRSEQGGLARAVAAQHRDHLSGPHLHRHVQFEVTAA